MEDLARLLFAILVDAPSLVCGEIPEDTARDVRFGREHLKSSDESVAPERDREPRKAGGGVGTGRIGLAEHAQVVAALVQKLVQRMVVGLIRSAVRGPDPIRIHRMCEAAIEADLALPLSFWNHIYDQAEQLAGAEPQHVLSASRLDGDTG